ncbi:hypothetical protein [Ralstonia syzygii]
MRALHFHVGLVLNIGHCLTRRINHALVGRHGAPRGRVAPGHVAHGGSDTILDALDFGCRKRTPGGLVHGLDTMSFHRVWAPIMFVLDIIGLVWLFGGIVALGMLARWLPPQHWAVVVAVCIWAAGVIPALVAQMTSGTPAARLRAAARAGREYWLIMAVLFALGMVGSIIFLVAD